MLTRKVFLENGNSQKCLCLWMIGVTLETGTEASELLVKASLKRRSLGLWKTKSTKRAGKRRRLLPRCHCWSTLVQEMKWINFAIIPGSTRECRRTSRYASCDRSLRYCITNEHLSCCIHSTFVSISCVYCITWYWCCKILYICINLFDTVKSLHIVGHCYSPFKKVCCN